VGAHLPAHVEPRSTLKEGRSRDVQGQETGWRTEGQAVPRRVGEGQEITTGKYCLLPPLPATTPSHLPHRQKLLAEPHTHLLPANLPL